MSIMSSHKVPNHIHKEGALPRSMLSPTEGDQMLAFTLSRRRGIGYFSGSTRYLGCSPGTFVRSVLSVTIITLGTRMEPHLSHGDGVSVRHSMHCHQQPVFFPCVLNLAFPSSQACGVERETQYTRGVQSFPCSTFFKGAVMPSRSGLGMCLQLSHL